MSDLKVVVAPVGRVDFKEVEAAVARVSKVLGAPVELREAAPLTRAAEDSTRGQYRSGPLLAELRRGLPRLSVVKVGETEGGAATAKPDVVLFITDVDLFTPQTDSVLGDLDPANKAALVSTRRLLEAFYRRKSDPARQRSRLVKQILRVVGLLRGLSECRDPGCSMSGTRAVADIDRKKERYCAPCWRHLSTGAFRV
jgi:predicted Zn-dependent protease